MAVWTDNGPYLYVTRPGLSLNAGATYYFSVVAENNLFLQSAKTVSDGQFIIGTEEPIITPPPEEPEVNDKVAVYPNPHDFSAGVYMKFKVEEKVSAPATVKIYTLGGKLIRELVIPEGQDEVLWDGRNEERQDVAMGIYLVSVRNNGAVYVRKAVVLR